MKGSKNWMRRYKTDYAPKPREIRPLEPLSFEHFINPDAIECYCGTWDCEFEDLHEPEEGWYRKHGYYQHRS